MIFSMSFWPTRTPVRPGIEWTEKGVNWILIASITPDGFKFAIALARGAAWP